MELDGLKKTWEVYTSARNPSLVVSKSSVENILKQRAEHARRKIVKLMGLDAVLMLLVNSLFIAILYYLGFQSRHLYALLILIIAMLLFVHYHFNLIIIHRSASHQSIYEGIKRTLMTIKRYFRIYILTVPTSIFIILFITQRLEYIDLSTLFTLKNGLIFQFISSLLAAILSYGGLTFIIRRLYKKDLAALENLMEEMSE